MVERQDAQEMVTVRLDRATHAAYERAADVLGVPVAAVLDAVVAAGEAVFARLAGGAAGSSPATSLPREGLGLYLALTCGGMIMGDATQCSLPGALPAACSVPRTGHDLVGGVGGPSLAADYPYAAASVDPRARA